MLDIEFLRQRPRLDDPVVIYRYRDGALRVPMKRTIIEILAKQNIICEAAEPEQLTSGSVSLFDDEGARLCDLRERVWVEKGKRFHHYDALHAGLKSRRHKIAIVLAPEDSPFFVHPAWSELRSTYMLIDEVAVHPEILMPLLRCLVHISDLAPATDLVDQPGFLASFDDLFGRSPLNLSHVIAAFESRVLTQTDPITGRVAAAGCRSSGNTDLGRVRDRVSALLIERDGWATVELAQALDGLRWKQARPTASVVRDLYWATARMLEPTRPGQTAVRPPLRALVVWATVLLGWEDRLAVRAPAGRRPEEITTNSDRLGRDALRRLALASPTDPIAGLWRPLEGALAAFASSRQSPIAKARARLIRNLLAVLSEEIALAAPSWIVRLHSLLDRAVHDADQLAASGDI